MAWRAGNLSLRIRYSLLAFSCVLPCQDYSKHVFWKVCENLTIWPGIWTKATGDWQHSSDLLVSSLQLWRCPDRVTAEPTLDWLNDINSIQLLSISSPITLLSLNTISGGKKNQMLQYRHVCYIGLTHVIYLYLFPKMLQCDVKNKNCVLGFSTYQLISLLK